MRDGGHEQATPRLPAHAGTFYPASPEAIRALVDRCLEWSTLQTAGPATPASGPLGILVPHAGLVYSGAIAARGWSALATEQPETIVIAGTNHVAGWVRGAAVWPSGEWLTPISAAAVDDDLAARIVELGEGFAADRAAHRREHAIEVQLPFLARLLPAARIVPITVSFDDPEACIAAGERVGDVIAGERAAGRSVAVAVSTDFAHYPSADDARRIDREMLEPIAALDAGDLARREAAARRAGIPALVCALCGLDAALFGLAALRTMGASRGEVLAEATSADVPFGEPDRVVGYAAVAFA